MAWRVGSKVPLNVYKDNRPVCQCHNAEDAREIVYAMNRIDRIKAIIANPLSPEEAGEAGRS